MGAHFFGRIRQKGVDVLFWAGPQAVFRPPLSLEFRHARILALCVARRGLTLRCMVGIVCADPRKEAPMNWKRLVFIRMISNLVFLALFVSMYGAKAMFW
jgi:hypothetical protein